jgi:hypothetical protein
LSGAYRFRRRALFHAAAFARVFPLLFVMMMMVAVAIMIPIAIARMADPNDITLRSVPDITAGPGISA